MDPSKTAVVAGWPSPQSKREMQQFLGLANYYRKFVKNFAAIAKPLHRLTEKNTDFKWTVECQHAFDALRACLISPPVLSYTDYSRRFVLDTDASDIGIGAVLSQVDASGSEVVIAYASRTLSHARAMYSFHKAVFRLMMTHASFGLSIALWLGFTLASRMQNREL